MTKRWTYEDDVFLLTYHDAVGADFVASHDLGRPDGAGSRRLAKLNSSGARYQCARMMLSRAEFEYAAGRISADEYDYQLSKWAREAEEAALVASKVAA